MPSAETLVGFAEKVEFPASGGFPAKATEGKKIADNKIAIENKTLVTFEVIIKL